MLDTFRETNSCDEIHSILKLSHAEESIVWQNENGKRNIFSLTYFKYFESIQTLELHLRNYDETLKVDETIYIKLSHRDAIFKAQVLGIEKDVLTLFVPSTLKAQELRSTPRLSLDIKLKKVVSVNIGSMENPLHANELDFITTSISKSGLCLIISDNNKMLFDNNDMYELTRLGRELLNFPIGLKQCWIQRYRYREGGKLFVAYRSGFEFNTDLSEHFISQFSEK